MDAQPLLTEQDFSRALDEIARYFVYLPSPGTAESTRSDVLAELIATYEATYWPIDPAGSTLHPFS